MARVTPYVAFGVLLAVTAENYGVDESMILGRRRDRRSAWPRQMLMFLSRKLLGLSWTEIGNLVDRRDHTTAMNGYRAVTARIDHGDESTRGMVRSITQEYARRMVGG